MSSLEWKEAALEATYYAQARIFFFRSWNLNKADLNDSHKIILIWVLADAAPQFIIYMQQSLSQPFPLPLSQLSYDWLSLVNKRLEQQVGGASVL